MEAHRTAFAMQAISLAGAFEIALHGSLPGYLIELSAPEGMSTQGGRQSLQHIKLVPDGGGATIVAGSVNSIGKLAELRTFDHLRRVHEARFRGAPFPVAQAAYEASLGKMRGFFNQQEMIVKTADLFDGQLPAVAARSDGSHRVLYLLATLAVVAVAALVVWSQLLRA